MGACWHTVREVYGNGHGPSMADAMGLRIENGLNSHDHCMRLSWRVQKHFSVSCSVRLHNIVHSSLAVSICSLFLTCQRRKRSRGICPIHPQSAKYASGFPTDSSNAASMTFYTVFVHPNSINSIHFPLKHATRLLSGRQPNRRHSEFPVSSLSCSLARPIV